MEIINELLNVNPSFKNEFERLSFYGSGRVLSELSVKLQRQKDNGIDLKSKKYCKMLQYHYQSTYNSQCIERDRLSDFVELKKEFPSELREREQYLNDIATNLTIYLQKNLDKCPNLFVSEELFEEVECRANKYSDINTPNKVLYGIKSKNSYGEDVCLIFDTYSSFFHYGIDNFDATIETYINDDFKVSDGIWYGDRMYATLWFFFNCDTEITNMIYKRLVGE